jgi:hypothetical protein
MNTEAIEDRHLRKRLEALKKETAEIEVHLSELGRPRFVDAEEILRELRAREVSKRRIKPPSKREERSLDDELWLECVLVEE